jgi:hypothetical protein
MRLPVLPRVGAGGAVGEECWPEPGFRPTQSLVSRSTREFATLRSRASTGVHPAVVVARPPRFAQTAAAEPAEILDEALHSPSEQDEIPGTGHPTRA